MPAATKRKRFSSRRNRYWIIGWIQGMHNITQSYKLKKGETISFNQTFIGFNPGEGLFFYRLSLRTVDGQNIRKRCYTLILPVLPRLNVKIKALYEAPKNIGHRCFICQTAGGSDENVYNWNLNGLKFTSNNINKPEICLTNLTAGVYTIECLVSTNTQNKCDVIEFTVEEILTDTRIPQQDNHLLLKYISATEDKNKYKKIVIFLKVITIILFFAVVVLIYILVRTKRNSRDLQTVAYNHRGVQLADGKSSADVSQIEVENELYQTIEDSEVERNEYDYVEENFTQNRDADEKLCNEGGDQYSVLKC